MVLWDTHTVVRKDVERVQWEMVNLKMALGGRVTVYRVAELAEVGRCLASLPFLEKTEAQRV